MGQDGLLRFLADGRIEIDSNTIERGMRGIALDRKNALFAGHDLGAEGWAMADPTTTVSSVGRLPRADRGKPVLRASKHQITMAQTPIGTAEEHTARITSRLKIGADEIVHGETAVEGSGEFAQALRRFVMQSEGKSAQAALDALGKRLNIIGEYGLEAPPAESAGRPDPAPRQCLAPVRTVNSQPRV